MIGKVIDLAIEADKADEHVLSVMLLNVARTMKLSFSTARNLTNSQSMVIELLEAKVDIRSDARRKAHPVTVGS